MRATMRMEGQLGKVDIFTEDVKPPLHAGPNEPGAVDLAGEYRDNDGLPRDERFVARIPGEIRPYEEDPADTASKSQLLPRPAAMQSGKPEASGTQGSV